jgi:hypothetical protein
VQRHAHPNRSGQRPGFRGNRLLRRNRGGKRVGSGGEGGLHGVADDLEAIPVMGGDRRVEQLEMAVDGEAHRRLVLLPERRAAFNIREEEGDGAGRKFWHGPFPYVQPVAVCVDCRMTDDPSTSEGVTRRMTRNGRGTYSQLGSRALARRERTGGALSKGAPAP